MATKPNTANAPAAPTKSWTECIVDKHNEGVMRLSEDCCSCISFMKIDKDSSVLGTGLKVTALFLVTFVALPVYDAGKWAVGKVFCCFSTEKPAEEQTEQQQQPISKAQKVAQEFVASLRPPVPKAQTAPGVSRVVSFLPPLPPRLPPQQVPARLGNRIVGSASEPMNVAHAARAILNNRATLTEWVRLANLQPLPNGTVSAQNQEKKRQLLAIVNANPIAQYLNYARSANSVLGYPPQEEGVREILTYIANTPAALDRFAPPPAPPALPQPQAQLQQVVDLVLNNPTTLAAWVNLAGLPAGDPAARSQGLLAIVNAAADPAPGYANAAATQNLFAAPLSPNQVKTMLQYIATTPAALARFVVAAPV